MIQRVGVVALALIIAIVVVAIAGVIRVVPALSGELTDRGRWFKSLTVPTGAPGAGGLCCDISDGFPVEAENRGGLWFVNRHDDGWVPVPPEIVLKEVSIDEHAYLFIYNGNWRCFVPPLQGF